VRDAWSSSWSWRCLWPRCHARQTPRWWPTTTLTVRNPLSPSLRACIGGAHCGAGPLISLHSTARSHTGDLTGTSGYCQNTVPSTLLSLLPLSSSLPFLLSSSSSSARRSWRLQLVTYVSNARDIWFVRSGDGGQRRKLVGLGQLGQVWVELRCHGQLLHEFALSLPCLVEL
jgi:hypothetical protein